jgi:NAD-dependent histone deacetylase SIR2
MLADYGLDDPHVSPPSSQLTQDMFDIEVFRHDPSIFYSFAQKILPSTTAYSPTHAFLRLLQDKHKLLRVYTQNIDNLEQLAGVRDDKLVQCHGSFATASCMRCKLQVRGEEIREDVLRGEVPKCPACEAEREQQDKRKSNGKKRKRGSDWDDDDDGEEDDVIEGIMKVILSIMHF